MTDNIVSMHRAFLAEIRKEVESLRSQLTQLATVEAYHQRAIDSLTAGDRMDRDEPAPSESAEGSSTAEITDPRLLFASKHEACAIALRALNGQAKTQQIADWLQSQGYGKDLEPRILHNSCYTAMSRKEETFRKIGAGEWQLIE